MRGTGAGQVWPHKAIIEDGKADEYEVHTSNKTNKHRTREQLSGFDSTQEA